MPLNSPSPGQRHDAIPQLNNPETAPAAAGTSSTSSPPSGHNVQVVAPGQPASLDQVINTEHMELMVHLVTTKDIFNLAGDADGPSWADGDPTSVVLRIGLQQPYLMHQLLAFSAYHLSVLHPHKSASYAHLAVDLQTRAIALFNTARNTGVDKDNCVPALLFSSVLGHHLLAEMLANREHGNLTSFVDQYVRSLELQRGVSAVAHSSWRLLMQSELEPLLAASMKFTLQSPWGHHCHLLKDLVEASVGLEESEREACRQAIRYLQIGFDAAEAGADVNQMIFHWGMLSPPTFSELLKAHRFEALVILSYYALLLHRGRTMWQIGDSGPYILGMLADYLGPASQKWIEYPVRMMEKDIPITAAQYCST